MGRSSMGTKTGKDFANTRGITQAAKHRLNTGPAVRREEVFEIHAQQHILAEMRHHACSTGSPPAKPVSGCVDGYSIENLTKDTFLYGLETGFWLFK